MGKILGPDGNPITPDVTTPTISPEAKKAAQKFLDYQKRQIEKNPEAYENNPYRWNPKLEYDESKLPDEIREAMRESEKLTPEQQQDVGEFMDFITLCLYNRVDKWIERAYYEGRWWFHVHPGGRIGLKADETFSDMQREAIASQVWDAISREENKWFKIENR